MPIFLSVKYFDTIRLHDSLLVCILIKPQHHRPVQNCFTTRINSIFQGITFLSQRTFELLILWKVCTRDICAHFCKLNPEGRNFAMLKQIPTKVLCEKCSEPCTLNHRNFGVFECFSLYLHFSDRPFCHRDSPVATGSIERI